jgi:hypothetical protein
MPRHDKSSGIQQVLERRWNEYADEVAQLLDCTAEPVGNADPPTQWGVYLLFDDHQNLRYAGKAIGKGGLKDRLCNKHVSGSESHALQRALQSRFPDRKARREYIKQNVYAKWLAQSDLARIRYLELLLVWLLEAPENRQ